MNGLFCAVGGGEGVIIDGVTGIDIGDGVQVPLSRFEVAVVVAESSVTELV